MSLRQTLLNAGANRPTNGPVNNNYGNALNVVVSVGGDLLFRSPWNPASDIYVQAQYDEVRTPQGNFSYFPLTVGYRFQGID